MPLPVLLLAGALGKEDALVACDHLWFCHELQMRLQVAGTKVSPRQRLVPATTNLSCNWTTRCGLPPSR